MESEEGVVGEVVEGDIIGICGEYATKSWGR